MKLFQSLLLGPAALGLLAPINASASEVNLNQISTYSDGGIEINTDSFKPLSTKNPLLAGGEGMDHNHSDDDFSADSFSSTTTATFTANFALGAVEGVAAQDTLSAIYDYQIDLATSFTGNDSLDVSIKAGVGGNTLTELDLNESGGGDDIVSVDGIGYTFPLGEKTTVFVGNNMEGSTLYNTACVYGGHTNTLDDCGNSKAALDTGFGTSAGVSHDFGNGITIAMGYEGQGDTANGIGTVDSQDSYGAHISYTTDSYGISVAFAEIEGAGANSGTGGTTDLATDDDQYTAINAYWSPENTNLPSVSVGYEFGVDGSATSKSSDDLTHYFIGLQWDQMGPGTFGAAVGTKEANTEGTTEELMYEAFYSYPVNDGMTLTPIVFIKEESTAGCNDETGVILKTTFSF